MSARDGGPAFPTGLQLSQNNATGETTSHQYLSDGMTLRDYFAAKAMHAHLITDTVPGPACDALVAAAGASGRDPVLHLAMNAYEMADAMLRARAER